MKFLAVAAIVLSAAGLTGADLSSVKAERNLEKRAQKAMANAEALLKSAQDSYLLKGDLKRTGAELEELAESVELAYSSLRATRKNPSKSPKHFKQTEIKTRGLLRRLDDFREQMSVEDRDTADKTRAVLQKIHEELLEGIMGGKKH